MVVLAGYALILQIFSFIVLHIRYNYFKGSIVPSPDHPEKGHKYGLKNRSSI